VQRADLVQPVAQHGLDAGLLEDLAHDAASRAASDTNNSGIEAQVAFLVEHLSAEGTRALIDGLAYPRPQAAPPSTPEAPTEEKRP
jgi:hypothetical protein